MPFLEGLICWLNKVILGRYMFLGFWNGVFMVVCVRIVLTIINF